MSQKRNSQNAEFVEFLRKGDLEGVKRILLEQGNDLSLKKKFREFKETALHLAVRHGHESIVKHLLEIGADIHATDHHLRTVLHTAVFETGGINMITLILQCQGVQVNAKEEYGNTPVKLAAEKGNISAVKLLMEKGADITIADKSENTTLHVAVMKGHKQVLEMLLERVAHSGIIGKQNKDKNTPLHLAVQKESLQCVAMLLHSGAGTTVDVQNKQRQTPVELANGNEEIIDLLNNPDKAAEILRKKTKPPAASEIGRGGSVETDSPVDNSRSQVSSLATQGLMALPQILFTAEKVIINQQYTTTVNNGQAAIGPGSQVVNAQDATAATAHPVHPQLQLTGESHYDVNVTGGNASVGDHCMTNVNTGTPRTPSTSGSSDGPFRFPDAQENRDARTEPGAETSSGSPMENPSSLGTAEALPHQAPEETPDKAAEILRKKAKPPAASEIGRGGSVETDSLLGVVMDLQAKTKNVEAEHKECLRVLPYTDDDRQVFVQLYVYSGKAGIPEDLKAAAQECFGEMDLKLKWSDLYNDSSNVLNIASIVYPSGKSKRLALSEVDEINETINKNLPIFSRHRNITAVQASFKVTKAKQTEDPCIMVYVLGKGRIPISESEIPCTVGSCRVDIVDGFWVRTLNPWEPTKAQEQSEVLRLGASIGVEGEEASGTLGAVLKDENSNTLYLLSCDHVINHAEKLRVIHPGWNDHLNFLKYHLKEYSTLIDQITPPGCQEAKISLDSLQELEKLLEKFKELKEVKEKYKASSKVPGYTLNQIEMHEKNLEQSSSKQPRTVANYTTGVSRNIEWTDKKIYFIDAAIAKLTEDEVKNLNLICGGIPRIIGTALLPSGECTPATTRDIMGAGELGKSGSVSGYTTSDRLVGASVAAPCFMRPPEFDMNSTLVSVKRYDYFCENCAPHDVEEIQRSDHSTCKMCKVCMKHEAIHCESRWLKNCLCIESEKYPFVMKGDSGAVVFDKRDPPQAYLAGLGIVFGTFETAYKSYALASPLEIALKTLSKNVSTTCNLKLVSNYE